MWRRIHSNRDPRDTLYSELRKEFSQYFTVSQTGFRRLVSKSPRLVYGAMIVFLLCSAVLSFTTFRVHDQPVAVVPPKVNPMADGFSKIMDASERIQETLKLKKLVDSITMKKQLTKRDSLALDTALDRLQNISTH